MLKPDHYDNVKALLDRWADWGGTGEPTAEGAPSEGCCAPDARVHTVEDMEIEVNKRIVRTVHACVYDLDILERNAVLMHYGFMQVRVWRAEFSTMFDLAIESLFVALKEKVSC